MGALEILFIIIIVIIIICRNRRVKQTFANAKQFISVKIIITMLYIYHALTNDLSAHIIHRRLKNDTVGSYFYTVLMSDVNIYQQCK